MNQYGLTGPVSVIVILVGLEATTDFTSSGIPPDAYAAQLSFSTFRMFIQNTTSLAVTVSPFDHLYGLSVKLTTVFLFVYFGVDASERDALSAGLEPVPNQNSGRYSRCWRSETLSTLKKATPMNGKM